MKTRIKEIAAFLVIAVCVAAFAVIYALPVVFSTDEIENRLWMNVVPRILLGAAVFTLVLICGYGGIFKIKKEGLAKNILWCLPCLAVALANFPYSALADGEAQILRPDLVWLFLLKCLFIAISEELLFRAIVLGFLQETFKKRAHRTLICILISSALFSVFHLLNLIEGAGLGATVLQAGYTFLTGIMFAAVTLKTGNIWAAVLLHFIFDVGGLIVTDLGQGAFQDTVFWVLTAVCAAVCAVHLIIYAINTDRSERTADVQSKNTESKHEGQD